VNQSSDPSAIVDGAAWLQRWDDQQEGYMTNREERFSVILDVVGSVADGNPSRILDLGCGPGSLARRLLDRFPATTVVALDNDPVLMLLGRRAYADGDGRLTWVQADLRSPDWPRAVAELGRFDAVVSTTALHWLERDALRAAYAGAVSVLEPDGVIVNGDHFFEPEHPRVSALQASLRQVADDGDAWSRWWEALESAVGADEELAAAFAERAGRGAYHPEATVTPPLEDHVAALGDAGFTDTGTVWQYGDDRVLVAMR
jgi:SAM-dependent methyltransferase